MTKLFLSSSFFIKLSKHVALLVLLLVLSRASGRYAISPVAILTLAIAAGLLHLTGRVFQLRLVYKIFRNGFR
jgi:hypothetical protein